MARDDPMPADEARRLTDEIKRDAKALWDKVIEAYHGRADAALGYNSWDQYCAAEFSSSRLRLPREERQAVVKSLREWGLSYRAVASTLGVSEGTVRNDQKSGAQNYAPETDAEADELAEELIEAEPTRPIITGGGTKVWPATRLTVVTTGLDGKSYRPSRGWPKPLEEPTVAEQFDREMNVLDCSIDKLSGLVAEASDVERAELANRWADVVVDRAARLSALYRD